MVPVSSYRNIPPICPLLHRNGRTSCEKRLRPAEDVKEIPDLQNLSSCSGILVKGTALVQVTMRGFRGSKTLELLLPVLKTL